MTVAGRCFHHLGILDCAVRFYELCFAKRKEARTSLVLCENASPFFSQEKALETDLDQGAKGIARCVVLLDGHAVAAECRSIEREAAYNLCIILKQAGNTDAALRVMREHLSF